MCVACCGVIMFKREGKLKEKLEFLGGADTFGVAFKCLRRKDLVLFSLQDGNYASWWR